jgi:hypothetical protein
VHQQLIKNVGTFLLFALFSWGISGCQNCTVNPSLAPSLPSADTILSSTAPDTDASGGMTDMQGFQRSQWGDSMEQVIEDELTYELDNPELAGSFRLVGAGRLAGISFRTEYIFTYDDAMTTKLIAGQYIRDVYLSPGYQLGMEQAVRDFEELRQYFTELYGKQDAFSLTCENEAGVQERVEADSLDEYIALGATYAEAVWQKRENAEVGPLIQLTLSYEGEIRVICRPSQDVYESLEFPPS